VKCERDKQDERDTTFEVPKTSNSTVSSVKRKISPSYSTESLRRAVL
jgi:hypothetical protein